ncbi:MAG: head-tail adaptor protein [Pseudomonadota bacterium]
MKAGKRDDLITIERNGGTAEDTFGGVQKGWATYATVWAEVVYGTGSERRQAGNEGAQQSATFRVLADPETLGVTTADRINFNGTWDIVNVSPLARDGIEYTAMRRSAA